VDNLRRTDDGFVTTTGSTSDRTSMIARLARNVTGV
jgi:hypothetical protein